MENNTFDIQVNDINKKNYFVDYPEDFVSYTLEYLLDRAENQMMTNTVKKIVVPNLDILKLNRKTYINNIDAISKKLNRPVSTIKDFFSSELRCSASIKGDGTLKFDRIFHLNNLNPVYTAFVKSIQCSECKSINTIEQKINRIIIRTTVSIY